MSIGYNWSEGMPQAEDANYSDILKSQGKLPIGIMNPGLGSSRPPPHEQNKEIGE